jgi:hypothetical protein
MRADLLEEQLDMLSATAIVDPNNGGRPASE